MEQAIQKITPFLWFDDQAEDAANFYTSIFPKSKVVNVTRYTEEGAAASGTQAGAVMTVEFQLHGQNFVALNGGPHFKFNEAISFVVNCETQEEVDHYWDKLSAGGDEQAQQCGWLKDRYGVSWQIVPRIVGELMAHPDQEAAQRAMRAILQMKKIDIETLQRAAEGQSAA